MRVVLNRRMLANLRLMAKEILHDDQLKRTRKQVGNQILELDRVGKFFHIRGYTVSLDGDHQ